MPLLTSINALRDYFTTSSCSGRLILVEQPAATTGADAASLDGGAAALGASDADYDEDDRRRELGDESTPSTPKTSKYDVTWLHVTHDASDASASAEALWTALCGKLTRNDARLQVWFKAEAPIVAVCARDIDAAQALRHVCRIAGVKRAAVTSLDANIVLSIADTHKVETLVASAGRVLVTRDYFGRCRFQRASMRTHAPRSDARRRADLMVRVANEKLLVGRQRLERFRAELLRRLPPRDSSAAVASSSSSSSS